MKKRGFLNLCAVAALATVTAGSLYSCKDYDDEIFAELGEVQSSNQTLDEKLAAQNEALEAAKKDIAKAQEQAAADKKELEDKLTEVEEGSKEEFATKEALAELEKRVKALEEHAKAVDAALETKADKADVEAVLAKVTEGDQALKDLMESELVKLSADVDKKIEAALANRVTTDEFNKLSDEVAAMKADLQGKIDAKADKKEVEALKEEVAKKDAELNELLKKEIAGVKELISKNSDKISTFESSVAELQKKFGEVETGFDEVKKQMDALSTEVAALREEVKKVTALEEALNNMVTSLHLNGAYSPVVGYFALPTGLKSNILAAYYGSIETTGEPDAYYFPTRGLSVMIGAEPKNERVELYGGKPMVADGWNAGKVYVTVNPSSVNMDGKKFSLVTSDGADSFVQMDSVIRKCEDKLAFGYTRAAGASNFYEVSARISPEHIANAKLRVEMDELKETLSMLKSAIENKSGLDVTQLASSLFMAINDIADANALKATWTTNNVEHSVASDLGLAAVAVKPLSYDFMRDYEITNFWGMDYAYKALDKVVAEAKEMTQSIVAQFPHFEVKLPEIKKVEVTPFDSLGEEYYTLHIDQVVEVDLDFETCVDLGMVYPSADNKSVTIKGYHEVIKDKDGNVLTTIDIPEQTVDFPAYNVGKKDIKITAKDVKIPLEFDVNAKDMVKGLYDEMTKPMGDVNQMLDELDKFLKNDLQNMIDQINGMGGTFENSLNQMVDKVNSKLNSLIGKINNGLCKIVNNVNEALQPVMFAQAGDFVMVSRSQNAPSVLEGKSLVLVPSSYSAEFLAPAAQKYVAVTNVIKGGKSALDHDAECVKVLKEANANNADLNKVLEGGNHAVAVDNLVSGYTYEFTYSAVDYYGIVRNVKSYVAVK